MCLKWFSPPAWLNTCLNWKLYNPAEKRLQCSLTWNYVPNAYSHDHLNRAILASALCQCSLLTLKNCCLRTVKQQSTFLACLWLPVPVSDGVTEGRAWLTGIPFWLCFTRSVCVTVTRFTEACLREPWSEGGFWKKTIGRGGCRRGAEEAEVCVQQG